MTYRGQKEITTRIIGKKSLIIKAIAWKDEFERLTIGSLELGLDQLISRARILTRGHVVSGVSRLFVSSLFYYIFFRLLIYMLNVFQPRVVLTAYFGRPS